MTGVVFGELILRQRTRRTIQLTQNPERMPLGVLAFVAVCLQGFKSGGGLLCAITGVRSSALGFAFGTSRSPLAANPLFLSGQRRLSS